VSCGICAGDTEDYTDFKVTSETQYALDFPKGRCAGHAPTGVKWTAPEAAKIDIVGAAWKLRNSDASFITLWVKGRKLIDRVIVPEQSNVCNSEKPYSLGKMIAGNRTGVLRNIAVEKGDEIIVEIGGNDFAGLDFVISSKEKAWDFAKSFSYDNNPNGPWTYGRVDVNDAGEPTMVLFETMEPDFTDANALFGKNQPAWLSKNLPYHLTMMKSIGTTPFTEKVEARFCSERVICVEELLDGQWVNRYWTADGRLNLRYENWVNEAFYLEIDKVPLSKGWQLLAIDEVPQTEKGARHIVVELKNATQPLNVKLHTLLDGTPILTRWMEITNTSDRPAALTAISPWTGKLWAHSWVLPHLPAERPDLAFTLGYFHQNYRRNDAGHGMEGWFQWEVLPIGTTEIGCSKGQCYDDPFFILRNEAKGQYTICHLAWSTNWYATFDCQNENGQQTLRFKIGPKAADALCVISPGETTISPAVHLGHVANDLDTVVQAMHEHIRGAVLPVRKPERSHLIQYSCPGDQGYLSKHFGDRSYCTTENIIKNVDLAVALGAELFIMDAQWWDNQGDWFASPTRFPDNGLQKVVEYVHKKGMLFGLYGEIERAHPGSEVHREHPDWIGPGNVLKMNRPEVAAYVESALIGLIERYGVDLYRLDHNKGSIMEGTTTERDGYIENDYWRYYQAFYGMMERIHQRYPDVVLQQCSCGGGRNDLGVSGRFHETHLTDGLMMPYVAQNFSGQTLALPPEIILIALGANGGGSIGFPEHLETYMRVTFTLSTPWIYAGMVGPSVEELSPDRLEGFVRYGKIYREFIRPILPTCKMYHHAPVSSRGGVESSGYFAMEYAAPDRSKGWATIIRVGPSESDTYVFKPRGLRRGKKYRVTIDSIDETFITDGLTLITNGLPARLESLSRSELFLFEESD